MPKFIEFENQSRFLFLPECLGGFIGECNSTHAVDV